MWNEGLKFQRDRAQGLAAMLDLRKILNNVYSGTTVSINVKHQSYDGTGMWNEGLKFQLDRAQGLAAMLG